MSTSVERSLDAASISDGRASCLREKLYRKLGQVRSQGLGPILRKAFRDHVYRRRDWVILERFLEVSETNSDAAAQADVIVVEPGDSLPDLPRQFSAVQIASHEATIRAGCTGFFAVKDGEVVGVVFGSREDYYEVPERSWFRVSEGEAYMFGWLIAPGHRSFTIASRLVKAGNAHMATRGCRRLYCAVESWNTSSLGPLLFLGYQEAGEVLIIRRLLRWAWSTREAYREPRFARYQRKRASRARSSG
jgi:RimJ/RimL family protein N-acetyltransferase